MKTDMNNTNSNLSQNDKTLLEKLKLRIENIKNLIKSKK